MNLVHISSASTWLDMARAVTFVCIYYLGMMKI